MPPQPLPSSANARLLINLYIPSAFAAVSQGLIVPTIPTLGPAFHVSEALAVQVVAATVLGRALMTLPSGFIVDRLGRRPAMILGPSMLMLGSTLAGLTPVFSLLLLAQFVSGAGTALWQLGREVAAVDLIPAAVRGRMLALFFGLQSAGSALGPLLGGVLNDHWGFRVVFWAGLVSGAIILALTARLPETRTEVPVTHRKVHIARLSDLAPEFRLTYLVLMVATFVAGTRNPVVSAVLPLHAEGRLGFSSTEVGALFAVIGAATLISMGPAGWISDTIGRKVSTISAAVLCAAAFVAYPYATSLPAMIAASALVGVAGGFALGAMTVYTYDIAPVEARGRLQALRRTMNEVGGVTGPAVAGGIISVADTGWCFLALVPLHVASAILLFLGARETAGKYRGLVPSPAPAGEG